jgi:radical SAM protein with 4Fe4S-binding SPASM domain
MAHRLHLNVTDRCNLRCTHCYWPEYGVHGDPSIERLDAIFEKFKRFTAARGESGSHVLTIGGGEATLRSDLEEVIGLACARGFDVRLVTNAVHIDRARAAALADAGLRFVQVSLEGATCATHESVRGNGTWARTMRGIEAFKETGVPQVLSYVLLPGVNLDEAPALLGLANELGVAGVKFARPIEAGQAERNALGRERREGELWDTFMAIVAHAQAIDYQRLLLFFDPLAHLLPVVQPQAGPSLGGLHTDLCQCNLTELVEVDAGSGDISYCRVRATLGNIWQDDLSEVWRTHPLLTGIRGRTPAGACQGCSVVNGCRGGCPAVMTARVGEPLALDDDCGKVVASGGGGGRGGSPTAVEPALVPAARLLRAM